MKSRGRQWPGCSIHCCGSKLLSNSVELELPHYLALDLQLEWDCPPKFKPLTGSTANWTRWRNHLRRQEVSFNFIPCSFGTCRSERDTAGKIRGFLNVELHFIRYWLHRKHSKPARTGWAISVKWCQMVCPLAGAHRHEPETKSASDFR